MLNSRFEVKRLNADDVVAVTDFIVVYYNADEEDCYWGKIDGLAEVNAERASKKLNKNLSVGVFEKSCGKLVAVMLCTVEEANFTPQKNSQKQFQKLFDIGNFFMKLKNDAFEFLKVDKFLEAGMVTIHPQYRKLGIGSFLMELSLNLAVEANCKYVVASTLKDFWGMSLERKGWSLCGECVFARYDLENGTNIFFNAKPDFTKARTLYKEAA